MNIEDADIVNAERDASPVRYATHDPANEFFGESERVHSEYGARQQQRRASQLSQPRGEPVEEVEEVEDPPRHHHDGLHGAPRGSRFGSSSTSSSVSSIRRAETVGARSRNMSTISKTSTKMERDVMEYLDRHPTAIARVEQHRLQHSQTVGSRKQTRDSGIELPDFGGGKNYPPQLPEQEEYVVEFSGIDDVHHAQNFAFRKKMVIFAILVFDSLAATFASSIYSPSATAVGKEFHVGMEVTTLGTSLFVLGYAVGPVVFAPISGKSQDAGSSDTLKRRFGKIQADIISFLM